MLSLASHGCLAPTLPIPPPSDPDLQVLGDGTVRVSGGKGSASANAVVIVINETILAACPSGCKTTESDIAGPDGSWGVVIPGKVADTLSVLQLTRTGTSGTLEVVVH